MHDDTEALEAPDAPAGPTASRGRRKRPELTPVQRALGLLTRREHSRKELTRKLTSRGLDPLGVEQAVDKLADAGWQDDARFAGSLVRSRAGTGYGPLHLKAELQTHGLDREQVARALDEFEGDWRQVARDLVLRRFPDAASPTDMEPARRRKAVELLMRRGFDGDCIRAALAGAEAGFDD
ncbi:regulatory protein RecX [Luteimonas sp. RIT-PG2_3]